ncbi:glycosyltransferase [Candidatus Peribacteria bacterium]|nr:glycosyltransferase [Candidatus Peribacteria bacterium]
MKRRKTLILDQAEIMGGAELYMQDFLLSLSESDVRALGLTVLGGKSPRYRQGLNEYLIVDTGFPFPSVKGGVIRKALSSLQILRAGLRLARIVRQEHVSQVLSNTARGHFIVLMARLFGGMRAHWSLIMHDMVTQKAAWEGLHHTINRMIFAQADTIICVNLRFAEQIRPYLGVDNERKLRIIENGVDLTRVPSPLPPERLQRVLMLGRYDPQKGQLDMLCAARILASSTADMAFHFVGARFMSDPKCADYWQQMQDFQAKWQLPTVHFDPETDAPYEEILVADMLVTLPQREEAFGRVVLEALSLNKLVLTYDEHGPREIVEQFMRYAVQQHGEELPSLIVPQSPEHLAEKLLHIQEHFGLYAPYTRYGRTFVEQHYSLSDTRKRLYQQLMSSPLAA